MARTDHQRFCTADAQPPETAADAPAPRQRSRPRESANDEGREQQQARLDQGRILDAESDGT